MSEGCEIEEGNVDRIERPPEKVWKMKDNDIQKSSIEALKVFNNAIVTSRLYPAESPQVTTALERGYKGVKGFLRQYGMLDFCLIDHQPYLCGHQLSEEVLASFANLVIYRQLRLLELPALILGSNMDRFAFSQLIGVFNAAAAKIKEMGGGVYFVTGLGLASYFPEDINSQTIEKVNRPVAKSKPMQIKARPELLACLLGKESRPTLLRELRELLNDVDSGSETILAAIVHLLGALKKKKGFYLSDQFKKMVDRLDELIRLEKIDVIAAKTGELLVAGLKNPAVYVVLAQRMESLFGNALFRAIVEKLDQQRLVEIFVIGREHLNKAKETEPRDSEELAHLGKAFLRLMNTEKGKQFLGTEKARALIQDGEIARKKKRVNVGMSALLQQNSSVLASRELIENLPETLRLFIKNKENDKIECIVSQLARYIETDRSSNQQHSLIAGAQIGQLLMPQYPGLLDQLTNGLQIAILRQKAVDKRLEEVVSFFHTVMQWSWQTGEFARGDCLLQLFYEVRLGAKIVPEPLRSMFAKVQDRGINRSMLPELLRQCFIRPNDRTLVHRLILQGPVAARFLIESLINAEKRNERMVIIDLLTTQEIFLPKVIHERLPENMPWYGKRNLLKLLGDTGTENDASIVIPYLRHEDLRVQREAFLALYKVSGRQRKMRLLEALGEASETIMLQIISALSQYNDIDVAGQLSDLLLSHEYFSDRKKNELLLQILDTLSRCPTERSVQGLELFLQMKGRKESRKIDDAVWTAAKNALKTVSAEMQLAKKQHQQASQIRKQALKQVAKIKSDRLDQRVVTGSPMEKNIRVLISQKNYDAAGTELLNLIQQVSRMRHFGQAEKLREWLIDLEPTSFSRIVKAAEIIEKEKVAAIDQTHLDIWSDLYDLLSPLEFSDMYHALTHQDYENEDLIVQQGSINNGLFFINDGKVKLFFDDKGEEVIVQTLGKGDIFGAGTFFEPSVWTLSVASVGNSAVSILPLEKLAKLGSKHSGLENALGQYCRRFERIETIIDRSHKDRRMYERYPVSGKITMEMVDNRGILIGVSSRGELLDLSLGGVSFLAKISTRENARLLLGRKVRMTVNEKPEFGTTLVTKGTILAVRFKNVVGDYSVHVKFNETLRRDQLDEIVRQSRKAANDM